MISWDDFSERVDNWVSYPDGFLRPFRAWLLFAVVPCVIVGGLVTLVYLVIDLFR